MATRAGAPSATDAADPGGVELSVVAPAYNEAPNVAQLVVEIVDVLESEACRPYRPFEVILVDDGSTDATWEQVYHTSRLYDSVRGIRLKRNFGQSAALAAGIDAAQGDVVVTIDADLQNDPADVPALLDRLGEGYDCVSGWRRERRDSLAKRVPSAVQTVLAQRVGPPIHDYGCTLKAYRAEALADVELYGEGHRYLPAKLHRLGYRVDELEVNHRPRENGTSNYGTGRLLRGFLDLCYQFFWVRYSRRPIHVLGSVGVAMVALGGFIGLVSVVQKYAFGVLLAPRTPRLILTALLILFGVQLLCFGVLAELLAWAIQRDERPYRVETVAE